MGGPQATKASQMWLSCEQECRAQVWLTGEFVHGEVYDNAFTGSNLDAPMLGPR